MGDRYGRKQGNCQTADKSGALWCYVDSAYSSSCSDLQSSTRYSQLGKAWSYEACSTPARNSPQCGGYGGGSGGHGGQEPICRGNSCYGSNSGQYGGSSGQYVSGGSISNCRHGQICNVGNQHGSNSGQYGSNSGQYGVSSGQYGNQYGSGSSIANCRQGQICNVGSSSGQYNSGHSSGQYNPYNTGSTGFSSGHQSLASILQGRMKTWGD